MVQMESMLMCRPAVKHIPMVLCSTVWTMSPSVSTVSFFTLPPITTRTATGRVIWKRTAYAHM